jgi:hypothetical protein
MIIKLLAIGVAGLVLSVASCNNPDDRLAQTSAVHQR